MMKNKGSILLEIAICISIMGVISGGLITYFSMYRKNNCIRITKENIETVTIALATYLAKNSRLPRASDDICGLEGQGSGKFVPYKELKIPPKFAKDGDGNALLYIVEPDLTQNFDSIQGNGNNVGNSFYEKFVRRRISVKEAESNADIAFVVDIQNRGIKFQNDRIIVNPSEYTMWVSRDMLLMKYLRMPLNTVVNYSQNNIANNAEDDLDF